MRCVAMLADWADAINGKLYIQGGGWTRIIPDPNGGVNFALAIQMKVGWNEANHRHRLKIQLLTGDGVPVEPNEGRPVVLEGQIEVGRPPGVTPGSELDAPLAMKFVNLSLPIGRYMFAIEVDDEPIGEPLVFDVVGANR